MTASGPKHDLVVRTGARAVALESTLLLHGVPRSAAEGLARELADVVRARGCEPALAAVVNGVPTVGVNDAELRALLDAGEVPKANTANLGVFIHRGLHAATTVSTTMELAARAGLSLFATGGLGGVHQGYGTRWDVSADLAAFTRFPVAVVASGVKSILDVAGTREALETLGVPVIGYRTDRFPAFYLRESEAGVDARFEQPRDLARYLRAELARTGRGVLVCNPIPAAHELNRADWEGWLGEARQRTHAATGRQVTPALLAALHEVSGGATLRANIELVKSNAGLAAEVCAHLNEY